MLPPLPACSGLTWADSSLKNVVEFLNLAISICQPNSVEIFDGTAESYQNLCLRLCASGQFAKLNSVTFPNSYIIRSNPIDVARSEDRTFVCLKEGEKLYQTPNSEIPKEIGFSYGCRAGEVIPETGKEMTTEEMRTHLYNQFKGCMIGRKLYIIPYSMGPVSSEYAKLGIQISDSAYVAVNMYTMTRTGLSVLKKISEGHPFVPSWHSVGVPLAPGEKDVIWPCRLLAKDRFFYFFYFIYLIQDTLLNL
jgi:phosphoenolpyruvate carboxykinase (GTP)